MTTAPPSAKGPRLCPRDAAELVEKRYEGEVLVDACPRCGGIWLDEGELRAVQEAYGRDHGTEPEGAFALAKSAAEQRDEGHGKPAPCPRCKSLLVSEEYLQTTQVVLDACPAGCGVWLDRGELSRIERLFEETRARAESEDQLLWKIRGFWATLRGKLRARTPASEA